MGSEQQSLTWRQQQLRQAHQSLGLGRFASEAEIKAAYRKRLLESHPDKPGGSDTDFVVVKQAYDTLIGAIRFEDSGIYEDDVESEYDDSSLERQRRSKQPSTASSKRERRERIFRQGVESRASSKPSNRSNQHDIDTLRTGQRVVALKEDLERLGHEALAQKDYARALQYFNSAASFAKLDGSRHFGSYAQLFYGRSSAHIGLDNWLAAMDDAKRAISFRPLWIPGLVLYSKTLANNGKWAAAVDVCRKGIDLCLSSSQANLLQKPDYSKEVDAEHFDIKACREEMMELLSRAEEELISNSCIGVMKGHKGPINKVVFDVSKSSSPRIATASDDSTARVWCAHTCECLHVLHGHTGPIRDVAWCPDESGMLVTAGDDGSAILWDVAEDKVCQIACKLQGHTDKITRVRFDKYGGCLATCSDDNTARLWDTETGLLMHKLGLHKKAVTCIAFSPTGRSVTTGSIDQDGRVWDLFGDVGEAGGCLHTLRWDSGAVTAVEYTPDGRFIVLATHDPLPNKMHGRLLIWSAISGRICKWYDGHTGAIWSLSWIPKSEDDDDNDDSHDLITGSQDSTLRLWNIRGEPAGDGTFDMLIQSGDGIVVSRTHSHGYLYDGSVFSTKCDPHGGNTVAAGSQDGFVRVYSTEDGEALLELPGHAGAVKSIDWFRSSSMSSSILASVSEDGEAKLWRYP